MLVSAAQVGRIDAFLKRAHKWDFCKDVVTLNELLIKSDSSLFHKMRVTSTPGAAEPRGPGVS